MEGIDNMLGTIVGIQGDKKRAFRVLLYTYNGKEWSFKRSLVEEAKLMGAIDEKKLYINNAEIVIQDGNKELRGTTGNFSRFKKVSKNGVRPLAIISELRTSTNKVMGYKIANYDCGVKNITWTEFNEYCKKVTADGGVPVQNAMYVPETPEVKAHIRTYPGGEFYVETLTRKKSEHAQPAKVNTSKNEKAISKLEEIFSPEQIREIRLGVKSKVPVKIYGNAELSADQMKIIREALEEGINGKLFADPKFSVNAMRILRADMRYGADVRYYLNPVYSAEQLSELGNGLIQGVDITKYSDPRLSPEKMAEVRMRLENNIWKEHVVEKVGNWN